VGQRENVCVGTHTESIGEIILEDAHDDGRKHGENRQEIEDPVSFICLFKANWSNDLSASNPVGRSDFSEGSSLALWDLSISAVPIGFLVNGTR